MHISTARPFSVQQILPYSIPFLETLWSIAVVKFEPPCHFNVAHLSENCLLKLNALLIDYKLRHPHCEPQKDFQSARSQCLYTSD